MSRDHIIAVDVGTSSARAGVFTKNGDLLARADHPIHLHRPEKNHAEYDSENIWMAVCHAVKHTLKSANIKSEQIAGLSFDATCSLVVRDKQGMPLSISSNGEAGWDTIVWLDHRAIAQAEKCSATKHPVLNYIGGVMSPEMQMPKLMWIKENLPQQWQKIGACYDLTDFLSYKATGSNDRSQCTLTCKWTYLAHLDNSWQNDFFAQVGLDDVLEKTQLPKKAQAVSTNLGALSSNAAMQLGLDTDCHVAVGLIDAHAGALGVLAGTLDDDSASNHLSLIAGTSSCVIALSKEAAMSQGIWGPYHGALLSDHWLIEGGQSVSGALLDYIIEFHSAGAEPNAATHQKIVERIYQLRAEQPNQFAKRLHVLPDFHGNRSPLANPNALGVISGLNMETSFDSLCGLYWRVSVSIALGLRHILDRLNNDGFAIDTIHVTGGHIKNPLLMELYADATGCKVIATQDTDAVLLGSAMVAAAGSGLYPSLKAACAAMQQAGQLREPNLDAKKHLDQDYKIFLKMHEQRQLLDTMQADSG